MTKIKLSKEGVKGNQINQFVIPFAYNFSTKGKTFNHFITDLCNPEEGKWNPVKVKEDNNELYEHILALISEDLTVNIQTEEDWHKSNYIGQVLQLNKQGQYFPNMQLTCKGIARNISFCFEQINLFLFDTGIAFLVLMMNYDQFDDIEQVIVANNQVKAIKHSQLFEAVTKTEMLDVDRIPFEDDNICNTCYEIVDDTDGRKIKYVLKEKILFEEECIKEMKFISINKVKKLKITHNIISDKSLEYKSLINDILQEFEIITFFNQSFSKSINREMCNKANVFSAVSIRHEGQNEIDINKAFYRLRKGYTESYNPNENEFSDLNIEVFKPFNDSFWGVSREGTANMTYDSNDFMKYGYAKRVTTYFYLYIIALHQYYGLLYLAKELSAFPSDIDRCSQDSTYKELTAIRNKCHFFYLKCIFDEVSHITHQALYYERLISVLGIKKMQQEINYETERISGIVEQVKEMEVQKEKETEEKNNYILQLSLSFIGIVFSIFSLVSTFDDVLSFWINVGMLNNRFSGFEFVNTWITLGAEFLVISLSCAIIVRIFKQKKIKK